MTNFTLVYKSIVLSSLLPSFSYTKTEDGIESIPRLISRAGEKRIFGYKSNYNETKQKRRIPVKRKQRTAEKRR
jgi:hypothetical protein